MRPLKQWLPFLIFIALMISFVVIDRLTIKKPKATAPPQGWQVIRPPNEVSAMALQGDIVWVGGKDGVWGIDRLSGKIMKELKNEPPFTYVRALLLDRSGILWIAHERGLTSYDGKALVTYTKKDGLPDDRINAICEDRDGKLWVGTWGGAAVREDKGWRVITSAQGLLDNMVNVIIQDNSGGMWFGSYVAPYGGVSYLKGGKWQHFSTDSGLPHNNVSAIFEDIGQTVWVGTGLLDRGGAAQFVYTPQGWSIKKVLTKNDGLAGEKVRSIFQDNDGVLWLGSEFDGIAYFKNGHWTILTEKEGLCNPEIKVMRQDKDGNLWMGTRDGIMCIRYKALQILP